MTITQVERLFEKLNKRRKELDMSLLAVSRRSGVSMPTVARILSGAQPTASFANVAAVADALGMEVGIRQARRAASLREQQAKHKAERLVGMVQGTSGLEEQGLDHNALRDMTRRTVHELLAGSSRRLWDD